MIHIKSALNIALVIFIQFSAWGLLWLASGTSVARHVALGIIFSFLLLTNYALMHESAHRVFIRSRTLNYLFGVLSSAIFPMSFTLFEVTHHVHHRGNRTDPELFDYYYPGESQFVKSVQWYGILTGAYYPFVPLGSLVMALIPWIYRTPLFTKRRTFRVLFNEFRGRVLLCVRAEVLFILLYWTGMYYALGLRWTTLVFFYALFGINWSTRQFVTHAWTPRDVMNGAMDLRACRPLGWILLNGQWDHVHHKFPYLPWTELTDTKYHEISPMPYLKQYLGLWRGIRPVMEPEPAPIMNIDQYPENLYR